MLRALACIPREDDARIMESCRSVDDLPDPEPLSDNCATGLFLGAGVPS